MKAAAAQPNVMLTPPPFRTPMSTQFALLVAGLLISRGSPAVAAAAGSATSDTVLFAVIDRRSELGRSQSALPAYIDSLRAALPERTVVSPVDALSYEGEPGKLMVQLFVDVSGVLFDFGKWKAEFIGSVRVIDARTPNARTAWIPIRSSAVKWNTWGNASGFAALSALSSPITARVAALASDSAASTRVTTGITLDADSAEYDPFLQSGTGAIAGQAFLLTRGGDVKKAAGREITLDPLTRLSRDWYRAAGMDLSLTAMVPVAPLFIRTRRVAVGDADGKFTFANVPAGTYLLRTVVTWEVMAMQGGVVSEIVTVMPGKESTVILRRAAVPPE